LFRTFCGRDFATKPFAGFDISRLLDRPTVIEIGRVPTQKMLTVFTYFVVSHVKLAIQGRESEITNLLVLEEAHSVLSPIINEGLRFELGSLLAECRGRGLSCIICEQSPSRIDRTVANLCGDVVSFRLVSPADREFVAQQLGVDAVQLNDLRKHNILIRTNSMYQPESVHVEVDDEILSMQPLSNDELRSLILSQKDIGT
jgi:DNA helicase HerA-like ATPase